jgi:hypothetical protein
VQASAARLEDELCPIQAIFNHRCQSEWDGLPLTVGLDSAIHKIQVCRLNEAPRFLPA